MLAYKLFAPAIASIALMMPAAASAGPLASAFPSRGPITWYTEAVANGTKKNDIDLNGDRQIQTTTESKYSSYNNVLKRNNLMEASASVRGSAQGKYIGAGATATVADVYNAASGKAEISLQDSLVLDVPWLEKGTVVLMRFDPARLHGQMKADGSGPEGNYWRGAAHVQYGFELQSGDRAKQSMTTSFSERSQDGGNPEQTFNDAIDLNPNGNSELEWEIVIGEETLISMNLWASATMNTRLASQGDGYGWKGGSAEASAWFLNTVYWGGIDSIRTLDGRLITDWSLASKFGIDWRTGSFETNDVPEPAPLALLGLGLAGLGFTRRRKA